MGAEVRGGAGREVTMTDTACTGGAGKTSSITGSSVKYAGGGGGSRGTLNSGQSSGGVGGGGKGGNKFLGNTGPDATNGTPNTGGGGGGQLRGWSAATFSGAGGSGVVVFSIPTLYYNRTAAGNFTVTVSGSNTILKFLSGVGFYTT